MYCYKYDVKIQITSPFSCVFVFLFSSFLSQIWSIDQPEWNCKIDEGSSRLVAAYWSSDSRHVLTMSDFHVRLTLWSLVNKSVSYIKYPKLTHGGLEFSPDGRYMALAERRDCKDHLSIFDSDKWSLAHHFPVATKDLAGLSWSPSGSVICVWESCLNYQLFLYTLDGQNVASYTPYSDPSQFGLGARVVSWSPTGQFLAVGGYDQKVRLLNHVTWKTIAELEHRSILDDTTGGVAVYNEVEKPVGLVDPTTLSLLTTSVFPTQSKYETQELPVTLPSVKPDSSKANPKLGIKNILFSKDSQYLVTQNENMPTTLWIWSIRASLVAVLTHTSTVRDYQWDPTQPRLAICTNTGRLYMWSPAGCVSVVVPADPPLSVQRLQWHLSGKEIALIGSTHFSVCFTE